LIVAAIMGQAMTVNNYVGEMAIQKTTDMGEKPCTIILFCFYQSCNIKMDFWGTGSEYQNRIELA
jgi:hypothetical protein